MGSLLREFYGREKNRIAGYCGRTLFYPIDVLVMQQSPAFLSNTLNGASVKIISEASESIVIFDRVFWV
jgi:hypothetical protein